MLLPALLAVAWPTGLWAPANVRAETLFVVNRKGDAADLSPGNGKCDVSTTSGKQCTLRAAIQEANALAGADSIQFDIAGSPKVIAPASPLPPIVERLSINGWSQAGTVANTLTVGSDAVFKIVLDGLNAGAGANGLELTGENSNIFGLVIQRFSGSGILISGTKNKAFGNLIGTNTAGTVARGNGVGVTITGDQNTVGGGFASRRNVISGNAAHGVVIDGAGAVGNTISNSYVGTDKSGTADLGNGGSGVRVGATSSNIVGVGSVADRNVISGNAQSGVTFVGTTNSSIVGNLVGIDAAGTQALGNAFNGIHLVNASNGNTIGGSVTQLRNVVSANDGDGIVISASNSNTVRGNRIGTKADGTGDLGNGEGGIVVIGSNNTIGGAATADANTIAGNDLDGIVVFGDGTTGNTIRGNSVVANGSDGIDVSEGPNTVTRNTVVGNVGHGVQVRFATQARIAENQIFGNGKLAIDLRSSGDPANAVTANDVDDADVGANGLQNFPIISSAVRSNATGVTTITLTLDSLASTQFTVEVYVAAPDASGHGEAQIFIATANTTTNASGDRTFVIQTTALVPGHVITASATSTTAGSTSELSPIATVFSAP